MLLYIFGILDILSALALLVLYFHNFGFAIIFSVYLLTKSLLFFDINSLFDFAAGIIIILAAYGIYNITTWLAVIWLLQKGIFSLIR